MAAPATVVNLVDARHDGSATQDWSRFADTSTATATADAALLPFAGSWLALAARQAGPSRAALLLLAELPGQPYAAVAAWPDPQRDLSALGPSAERALREGTGIAAGLDGGPPQSGQVARLAFPVDLDERPVAVVVLELASGDHASVETAMRALHWASGWLVGHLRARAQAVLHGRLLRSSLLNELMATALQQERLAASSLAVANALAERFGCSQVAVGLARHGNSVPLALSHTAHFDPRSDQLRAWADAMDEALDSGQPVWVPVLDDAAPPTLAHTETARRLPATALLSVPLRDGPLTLGVISLARNAGPPFSVEERQLLLQLGSWLVPVWSLKQAGERPLLRQAQDRLSRLAQDLHRPGRKLAVGVAALAFAAAVAVPLPHRVSARTHVEGLSQRVVLAPFDGLLAQTWVRAGDSVHAGQPLARLDDRELQLEQARWQSERAQQQRRLQLAMSQADRAAMGVVTAQIAQTEAQLALAQDRLARATLVAPFDAVVVAGDLHASLGMAVATGRLLFELAPQGGHRVVLQVDDQDIGRLATGQRGELVLASQPGRHRPFTVSHITPVSSHVDGHNVFRVEARLDADDDSLRPGMEGVGKVQVGERSALWVWTHGLVDWLRLASWGWTP